MFQVINRVVGRMKLFTKDADYEAFEGIVEETLVAQRMRICAYCVLPNHWHLVLWPEPGGYYAAAHDQTHAASAASSRQNGDRGCIKRVTNCLRSRRKS